MPKQPSIHSSYRMGSEERAEQMEKIEATVKSRRAYPRFVRVFTGVGSCEPEPGGIDVYVLRGALR